MGGVGLMATGFIDALTSPTPKYLTGRVWDTSFADCTPAPLPPRAAHRIPDRGSPDRAPLTPQRAFGHVASAAHHFIRHGDPRVRPERQHPTDEVLEIAHGDGGLERAIGL